MTIVGRGALLEFQARYPDSAGALNAWFAEAKMAQWKMPTDIKKHYGSASILKSSRVVFNICGKKYRLVVKIAYPAGIVQIRFIGTHKEYNKIDTEKI
jgi:mRNA interferase HigB